MQLRNTIMFIPKGESEVVKVEIFVTETVTQGLWNIDSNKILLTSKLYSEFRSCKTQREQGKFFSQLRQVSSQLI